MHYGRKEKEMGTLSTNREELCASETILVL